MITGDQTITARKSKFAMAFHGFQPVFNFESELGKAFTGAYKPFLEVMSEFPEIKGSFHFSGNMLEWFERRHPEYLELLKKMEKRGQIEMLGGGFFEPVMALIPRRDSEEQIGMMNRVIERIFGAPPKGAWTTERVWRPELADTFSKAGIKYTILDDYHLLSAGMDERSIFAPCVTRGAEIKGGTADGDRARMVLFPALTRFRYTMPFRRPEDTIEYMRKTVAEGGRDEFSFFFADDLEKFGA